jgi:hypothetical protein
MLSVTKKGSLTGWNAAIKSLLLTGSSPERETFLCLHPENKISKRTGIVK